MSTPRNLLGAACLAVALAATTATAAAATNERTPGGGGAVIIDQQFGSHDGHTYVPAADRPPVPATPVAVEAAAVLPAWSLGALPILGAAAGALAGLRRRWSTDA